MDTRDVVFEAEDLVGNRMVVTYTVPTEHFHPEMTELEAEVVCVGLCWVTEPKTNIPDVPERKPMEHEIIEAARGVVTGLDGTFGKTYMEKAAKLENQEHPEPVSSADLANLIRVLGKHGLVD